MQRRKWLGVSHVQSGPPDRVPSKSVDERIYLEEPAPTAFTSIGSTESVVNLASPINPFVVSVGGQARTI
jgi:hypothetical protein